MEGNNLSEVFNSPGRDQSTIDFSSLEKDEKGNYILPPTLLESMRKKHEQDAKRLEELASPTSINPNGGTSFPHTRFQKASSSH